LKDIQQIKKQHQEQLESIQQEWAGFFHKW
jgi:hypothetical protein